MTNLRLPGQYDERLFAAAGISGIQGPYYNWNRWYLPSVGRYLELDPLALRGGFNSEYGVDWYNYAGGNPLRWTDPQGLSKYDKFFGLPQKFWKWLHRHPDYKKKPGEPDFTKDEALDYYKEWLDEGKPGPDHDWIDWFLPFPPMLNPCVLAPQLCRKPDPCEII